MMLLAAALVFAGATGLCAAMERHHARMLPGTVLGRQRQIVLRITGSLLLAAGWLAASLAKGWGMGAVTWLSLCAAAILGLVLLLTYYPRRIRWIAGLLLLAGGFAALI